MSDQENEFGNELREIKKKIDKEALRLDRIFSIGSCVCACISVSIVIVNPAAPISLYRFGSIIIVASWAIHGILAWRRKVEFQSKYRFDIARLEALEENSKQ